MIHNGPLCVAAVDIGSLANLGWAVQGPSLDAAGTDIDECVRVLAEALRHGSLALGFEAPMFVPYGRDPLDLDRARMGDGAHAFSSAPGACVLTKALVVVPYILRKLRHLVPDAEPTFDWQREPGRRDLLLFEAFVSGVGKDIDHAGCARLACDAFRELWQNGPSMQSGIDELDTLNLLGAMLLRTGWTDDPSVLAAPCLVARHRPRSG